MNEKMQQMYDWIIENPNHNEREIAAGVGLKKTPYSRTILLYMWEKGYIVRWLDDSVRPACHRYFVQLTEKMEGF